MHKVIERIKEAKLVPVVKIEHIEDAVPVAKALCEGGLYLAEVTFRTVCAEEAIRRMKEACPQMLIGAGTVLNTQQVDEALASGAAFIVAPGFNEKVVNYCTQKGVPIFPGCSHASDIERAIEHGLEVVKFFPAKELGGLATIKALAAPYGQVNFMPTGGITPDTMMEYLDYERIVACGGSWMVKEDLIRQKDFKAITKLTAEAVKRIQKGKQGQEAEQHLTKEECAASQLTLEGLGEGVVAGFGEMLLRLSAPDHLRLSQAHQLKMHYGGAEANVVVSLAQFGLNTRFMTKLPENDLGQSAVNELRKYGVDTHFILRGGERMGLYFLEKGASQRASKVVYDRAHSAMSAIRSEELDWDKALEGVKHFFITGITPALGEEVARVALKVCKKCQEKGITVWCDLNYREKLWTKEAASRTLQEMMQYVDCCLTNEHHAISMLDLDLVVEEGEGQAEVGRIDQIADEKTRLSAIAYAMTRKYGFKQVALTIRHSVSASLNSLSALLYTEGKSYFAPFYDVQIVDRVGGGDAFAAGLIYATVKGYDPQESVAFALASECLKHTIEGDFNEVSVAEVCALMNGNGKGLVQR